MAEFVEEHLESMTTELIDMQRLKIFTPEEIKEILKRRKDFEYKINSISKQSKDFKGYIEFEKQLLKRIFERRGRDQILSRKNAIDYRIKRRIKNLYDIALQRFSDNYELWLSYFNFCRDNDFIGPASRSIHKMIKHFSFKPEVWQFAALFYINDRQEINTALEVLHKGIAMHKDSQMLYTEAINLELSRISTETSTSKSEERLKEICAAKVHTYVQAIMDNIKDFKYYLRLLENLEPYYFTSNTQNFIIRHLLKCHSNEPLLWDFLAQREHRGHHYNNTEETSDDYTPEKSFTNAIEKYKEGIKVVPKENKLATWSYYLNFLISGQKNDLTRRKCTLLLKKELEEACEQQSLPEEHFLVWFNFVGDAEMPNLLEKATNSLPKSVELWKLRLGFYIMAKNTDEAYNIFKLGVESLKSNSLPLWTMMMKYCKSENCNEILENIYKESMEQSEAIAQVLKPKYIQWLAENKNICEARRAYNLLSKRRPYCKKFHQVMLKLEMENGKIEECEKIYKLMCEQFGKEDPKIWIEYIRFYLLHKKDDNVNENVQTVYRDASNTLSQQHLSTFIEQFNDLLNAT